MNIDINKALSYQFADKKWINKAGPHIAVQYAVGILFVIWYFVIMAIALASTEAEGLIVLFPILSCCMVFIGGIFFFLYGMYFSGYTTELARNVMNKKDVLPEIKPFAPRIKEGLKIMVLGIVPMIVTMIPMTLMWILLIALTGSESLPDEVMVVVMLLVFAFMALFYLGIMVYGALISPAMYYIYLKKGLKAAFSLEHIKRVVKVGWTDFLLYFALVMAGSMAISFVMYIPIIGQLAYPFIMVMYVFVAMHLYGQTMRNVDEKVKLK